MKRVLCICFPDWAGQRSAVVREDDATGEREALQELAVWCQRFSPIVALEAATRPPSLLLDVTGVAKLFGGEAALAEKIIRGFARRKLTVRVTIADTLGAAVACAAWGCAKPQAALAIIMPGESLDALRRLPIEALRLPERTVGLLHQLGVERICQLEALPRRELSSRFGPELLRRWDQATGRLAEPLLAHAPPPEFQAGWSPEYPTIRRETIEAGLQHLIEQLSEQLLRCGRGCVRLECRLDCLSAEPVRLAVGLFQPTACAEHLFQLAQVQLERLRLAAPVSEVSVAVASTAPLEYRQQELFSQGDTPSRDKPRRLAALVDRLSNRLGRRAVVRPRLLCDAQPELAYRYEPLVGRRRRSPRNTEPVDLPPRPLRLLPRPIALASLWEASPTAMVVQGDFDAVGDASYSFSFDGRKHRVEHVWGPERIETGWWRGCTVGRDYYCVETTTGCRYWLFRRLRDGRWFVHGTFE